MCAEAVKLLLACSIADCWPLARD